jgi:hypothetical protein
VFISLSQNDSIKLRECMRSKFLAQEERKSIEIDTSATLKLMHFKTEFTYLLKAEAICGTFTKNNYNYIIRSGQDILKLEKDPKIKSIYIDTLFLINKKIDLLKFGDKNIVLKLADYCLLKSVIERDLCDNYYLNALRDTSLKFTDVNIINYYSNLYSLYLTEQDALKKSTYKKRLISDYFMLSKLITYKKLQAKSLESIVNVFNGIVRNCEDLLPDLAFFMNELPKEKEAKIKTVTNFLNLMKEKSCSSSKEYEMLVDTLIKIDGSIETMIEKAELLIVKKRYTEGLANFNAAKIMTEDLVKLDEIDFRILEVQFHNLDNYQTAYRLAMAISGTNKSKALLIAAKCVANSANSCGSSTFDRKCNYYYAAELAERAGDSGAASRYRAGAPSSEEKFNNNNPSSVSLSCWGVTVNVR